MRHLVLVTILILSSCASQQDSSDMQSSPYASSLPATDMVIQNSNQQASSGPSVEIELDDRVIQDSNVLVEEAIIPANRGYQASSQADASLTETNMAAIDIANTFTLQLGAFESMESAVSFARLHGIEEAQAGIARILSQGNIYYVLAYGVYTSREDADAASLEMQRQHNITPWIRRLSSLEERSAAADALGY